MIASELTVFAKSGGPLTKRISLAADGSLKSDGSACVMAQGSARRVRIANVHDLCALIERMQPNEAIALGALRAGLADPVQVVTKHKLKGAPNAIARTGTDIIYRKGQPALALLDFDTKGMPSTITATMKGHGSYWSALVSVLPELRTAARVVRRSTSAGIYRSDINEQLPGSNGLHAYVEVLDGSDIERFLKTLHDRCWLAGLGWYMIGAGGQLLERSIVDRMVFGPERLVFEADPILDPPLEQDKQSRRPRGIAGDVLDTVRACLPLTIAEKARLRELKAKAAYDLASERAQEREKFIATQAKRIASRKGVSIKEAMPAAVRQCEGILRPDIELPFDDSELAGCTVADVLGDPDRFEGTTLADPLEGTEYGICKAQVMRRADGTLWIHSFAHGRTTYDIKLDAVAARMILERADKADVAKAFIEIATKTADLDESEIENLRVFTAKKSELGARTINALLKVAQAKIAAQLVQEKRQRQLALRRDPRPRIVAPLPNEEWLPQIATVNGELGVSKAPKPPARNIEGTLTRARKLQLPKMHAFGQTQTAADGKITNLPVPEQWALHAMNEMEVAELIEQHIEFVDENDLSVHLPMAFVRHYVNRDDGVLPTVVAISTLPLVLADGAMLAPNGLDRERGIIFEIQKELRSLLPRRADCTEDGVREAMKFLTDKWLVDVATDYNGKCMLIAAAMTIIERSLLPDRPAFWVSAGRRAAGKTTTLKMLIKAVTGDLPSAAAWSTNEEERRKALMSYLLSGVAYILWDNINRGAQISCPHVEKSCTSAFYSDRKLGVSEMVSTAAGAVHLFTGNNVGPRGDLASRSLQIRLAVDRPDPENREFMHPDPIGWTDDHRAEILRALYTILLGNPTLTFPPDAKARTRFKLWWRLIGSAVEHAAAQAGEIVDFQELFLAQEEGEEDTVSLADALIVMGRRWKTTFKASDVADVVNKKGADAGLDESVLSRLNADSAILRDFLFGSTGSNFMAMPQSVGKRLNAHLDEPVMVKGATMVLRGSIDQHDKVYRYRVE